MSDQTIDLNADFGEGAPHDALLLTIVSSCNIACGGHAGDQDSMLRTVQLAASNDVSIGAHPSYPDREGFGRRSGFMEGDALRESLRRQIEALKRVCDSEGVRLGTLKPHGALYNDAAGDESLATLLVQLAADFELTLIGLPDSATEACAGRHGVSYLREGFIDRRYQADGSLTPRDRDGALIEDATAAAEQACQLAQGLPITAIDGQELKLHVETLCLHGDSPSVAETAHAVVSRFEKAGIRIASAARD